MHKNVLKQLMPIDLGSLADQDMAIEGAHLDAAETSAAQLLREMMPQASSAGLADWERVCGLLPDTGDTLQMRQVRVVNKLRERGGLSVPFYTAMAADFGYTVIIEELLAGTDGLGDEGIFRWRVTVTATPMIFFRAGQSRAGDRLVDGPLADALEGLFTELKPAHTQVIFAYA